jgi:hypothetical protein
MSTQSFAEHHIVDAVHGRPERECGVATFRSIGR